MQRDIKSSLTLLMSSTSAIPRAQPDTIDRSMVSKSAGSPAWYAPEFPGQAGRGSASASAVRQPYLVQATWQEISRESFPPAGRFSTAPPAGGRSRTADPLQNAREKTKISGTVSGDNQKCAGSKRTGTTIHLGPNQALEGRTCLQL